ncbi:MAG: type IX secretion system membrane protein PorP/SprF [Algoriphagus sp.]|nr:type IX secretion system membrane protein PorP/SprF [Algoriphagus sp.]
MNSLNAIGKSLKALARVSKALALAGVVLSSFNAALAQDIQYSQFYANPIYLNPAFAGSSEMSRMGVNYRNQWPGLDQSINSYSASFDSYLFNINSGVGLIVNRSQQSQANLSISEIGAAYSYRARLGFRSFLRVGGQVSYIDRDAYFGNLVFGSQIDDMSGSISDFSGEKLGADFRHQFVDYSAGLLFNNESVWFGLSAHHLSQPNISFLDGQMSQLPLKVSAHGGVKFDLSNGYSRNFMNNKVGSKELVLAFNYKNQEPFQQLDLGAQLIIQPLVIGLWYRGIPVVGSENVQHESLIGLVGISLGNGLDVGYSYDYNVSNLGNANSAGAHEISIRYSFLAGSQQGAGRKSSMPCFKY